MGLSSSITLNIYADITPAEAVNSYGVRANYEARGGSNLLNVPAGGVVSDAQWVLNDTIEIDNVAKTADVFDGTLGSGVSGPAVALFSITLQSGSQTGIVDFIMQDAFPDDPNFDGWVTPAGVSLDGLITYLDTEIRVVPIPGAGILFASSLLGLFGLRKKMTSV